MSEQIENRFAELLDEADSILSSRRTGGGEQKYTPSRSGIGGMSYRTARFDKVDSTRSTAWGMKCLTLLRTVFGDDSDYYVQFNEKFKRFGSANSFPIFQKAVQILNASKSDYDHGFYQLKERIEDQPNSNLALICEREVIRNTRIYLSCVFVVLLAGSCILFSMFGIRITSIITLSVIILTYMLSAISLKDYSLNKLHERFLEFERDRILRRFGIR